MFILILIVVGICIAVGFYQSNTDTSKTSTGQAKTGTNPQDMIIARGGVARRLPIAGRTSVVGEQFYTADIRAAIGEHISKVQPTGMWDQSLEVDAEVRRQPNNSHDPNAVVVVINGRIVGYIASDHTAEWQKLLTPMEGRGLFALATAAIYSSYDDGFSIVLKASPSFPETANECPEGHALEPEWQIAVSGEENAQDILAKYGPDSWIWASLKTGTIPKGKYKDSPTIFACVDGTEIGYISAIQSERYFIYIKRRLPCVCIAHIKQGGKKLELELMFPSKN